MFFTISQVTATTTSPPMTVVCSGILSTCYECYNGYHLCGLSGSFGSALCGSVAITDPKEQNSRCCWPCHSTAVATSIPAVFSGFYQSYHGSSSGEFSFSALSLSPNLLCWCLLHCCFLLSGSNVVAMFTSGAQPLGFALPQPFEV